MRSVASAARTVAGNHGPQIVGIVLIAAHPNISLMGAVWSGTPLTLRAGVPAANISGSGPPASLAGVGHYTRTGTWIRKIVRHSSGPSGMQTAARGKYLLDNQWDL